MKFYCNSAKLKGRRRRKKTVGTCFPFFLGVFSGGVKEKTAVNGAFLLFRVSPLLFSLVVPFFLFGFGGQ